MEKGIFLTFSLEANIAIMDFHSNFTFKGRCGVGRGWGEGDFLTPGERRDTGILVKHKKPNEGKVNQPALPLTFHLTVLYRPPSPAYTSPHHIFACVGGHLFAK